MHMRATARVMPCGPPVLTADLSRGSNQWVGLFTSECWQGKLGAMMVVGWRAGGFQSGGKGLL